MLPIIISPPSALSQEYSRSRHTCICPLNDQRRTRSSGVPCLHATRSSFHALTVLGKQWYPTDCATQESSCRGGHQRKKAAGLGALLPLRQAPLLSMRRATCLVSRNLACCLADGCFAEWQEGVRTGVVGVCACVFDKKYSKIENCSWISNSEKSCNPLHKVSPAGWIPRRKA